jgi:LacI family transcriptional regulator
LFVANSLLALGVLEALQQRKIKLGRDIGLITFDDAPWTPLIDPPISVVTQPAYEIGAEAARLLVGRIRGEISPEPTSVVLNTELIIRESCHRRPPRRSR